MGVNLVVKRGTNEYRGMARGYFDNDTLSSSNVPAELSLQGVTPETADHNEQVSDYGFDIGGPILKDKAWFYGSYSIQPCLISTCFNDGGKRSEHAVPIGPF